MESKPHIFRCRPHLCVKVWGGRRLQTQFGKGLPSEDPYGESWEVADLPQGQSVVDTGPMVGATLHEVTTTWGAELVGSLWEGDRFPLLVKILDASQDLSVQVHPGLQHESMFVGARSKDETWIILGVEEGGSVLHGFRKAVTPESFARAVADGEVVDLLRRMEVKPGDVLRVPPGTIHAICAGVVLLEIQQPSDTTYRVYDYGRPGLDGLPRPLHMDEAIAVTDFSGLVDERAVNFQSDGTSGVDWSLLVDVYAYRAERIRTSTGLSWRVDRRSAQVLCVLEGRCRVVGAEVELGPGQTAIVPACMGEVRLEVRETTTMVIAGLGGVPLVVDPVVGNSRRLLEAADAIED
jgi:mannose-6-phosphate isomerase